ncbi:MAG: hypothetical protein E6Q67_05180 [Roseateles sp.]|nr:MAG: hypothetical protein E6Q67_05180 [Roseateles sp.]
MVIDAPETTATAAVVELEFMAYCDDSGQILVKALPYELPPRHTLLARGPLLSLMQRFAIHARQVEADGLTTFYVPGMPEAASPFIAAVALRCWVDWCAPLETGRVVWNRDIRVAP